MRQQRRQRTTSVAPSPQAAPTRKVSSGLPETGYALIVDGRAKSEFETKEGAGNEARELKQRFPMLQIKVYDAEAKRSEEIVLTPATPMRFAKEAQHVRETTATSPPEET